MLFSLNSHYPLASLKYLPSLLPSSPAPRLSAWSFLIAPQLLRNSNKQNYHMSSGSVYRCLAVYSVEKKQIIFLLRHGCSKTFHRQYPLLLNHIESTLNQGKGDVLYLPGQNNAEWHILRHDRSGCFFAILCFAGSKQDLVVNSLRLIAKAFEKNEPFTNLSRKALQDKMQDEIGKIMIQQELEYIDKQGKEGEHSEDEISTGQQIYSYQPISNAGSQPISPRQSQFQHPDKPKTQTQNVNSSQVNQSQQINKSQDINQSKVSIQQQPQQQQKQSFQQTQQSQIKQTNAHQANSDQYQQLQELGVQNTRLAQSQQFGRSQSKLYQHGSSYLGPPQAPNRKTLKKGSLYRAFVIYDYEKDRELVCVLRGTKQTFEHTKREIYEAAKQYDKNQFAGVFLEQTKLRGEWHGKLKLKEKLCFSLLTFPNISKETATLTLERLIEVTYSDIKDQKVSQSNIKNICLNLLDKIEAKDLMEQPQLKQGDCTDGEQEYLTQTFLFDQPNLTMEQKMQQLRNLKINAHTADKWITILMGCLVMVLFFAVASIFYD